MGDQIDVLEPNNGIKLSPTDRQLLSLLQQNSRRSVTELAAILGLSRTTIRERVEHMVERGVIRRFTVDVADIRLGDGTNGTAIFQIRLKRPVCRIIYGSICGWPELLGCWSIAGDIDMVILLSCSSNVELERLRDRLARHPEVKSLTTLSILREWTHKASLHGATQMLPEDSVEEIEA
ncbi:transcriptional regulator, AsnC family [Rhizobiales bacterium GAS191]|jgi:Lrp/AsnC family leucine-responsive transcriptional regulator|nr:transcriptional regulator, AsnC family [Rhizobiales bacterium GAS113]SEC92260.1 transcriptional regulator, AsnC family [Rhizobiales bacterium GAS191]